MFLKTRRTVAANLRVSNFIVQACISVSVGEFPTEAWENDICLCTQAYDAICARYA